MYRIDDTVMTILVIKIGHRRDVYDPDGVETDNAEPDKLPVNSTLYAMRCNSA
jgi:hypothetical protein